MAYTNDIPQPADRIKASQNDILQNFLSISTLIGIDHVNFDAPSGNQGKHNVVSMPNFVGGAASPVSAANEIKMFAKNDGINTQLFILPRTGGGVERNITARTGATTGECTLPSGIKIKWGDSTTDAGGATPGQTNINFVAVGLTSFGTIFQVYTTITTAAGNPGLVNENFSVRVFAYAATDFDLVTYLPFTNANVQAPFSWFAIGI